MSTSDYKAAEVEAKNQLTKAQDMAKQANLNDFQAARVVTFCDNAIAAAHNAERLRLNHAQEHYGGSFEPGNAGHGSAIQYIDKLIQDAEALKKIYK